MSQLSNKFENAKPDRKSMRDEAAIRAAAKMGFSDKGFRASNPICKLLTTSRAKKSRLL
jgi:hypothetical protein